MSAVIQLRPPTDEKPTVRGRDKNEAYRVREYLTEAEIEKLLTAASKSRNPNRDRLLVLMAYRHALRVSELVDLRVDQIDLKAGTIQSWPFSRMTARISAACQEWHTGHPWPAGR